VKRKARKVRKKWLWGREDGEEKVYYRRRGDKGTGLDLDSPEGGGERKGESGTLGM